MIQTYKNNTGKIQHLLDGDGNPQKAEIGETITYLSRDSRPANVDGLDVISETDENGVVLYIGYAVEGTAENEQGWAIKKRVVVGSVERWKWAEGGFILRYRWTQRASLIYR